MKVAAIADDCKTADDVRARAAAVWARIQQRRAPPKATAPVAQEVTEPEPTPDTAAVEELAMHVGEVCAAWALCDACRVKVTEYFAPAPPSIRVADIIAAVAFETGVSAVSIKSPRRTARVVRPRQLVMALARQLTLRSLPEIGMYLGGRDHTTVLHGARKLEQILDDVGSRIGEDAPLATWVHECWAEILAEQARTKAQPLVDRVAA